MKVWLDAEGIVSKRRTAADGSPYGSNSFSRGALYQMLQNRVYRGEIVHKAPLILAGIRRSSTKTYGRACSESSKPTTSSVRQDVKPANANCWRAWAGPDRGSSDNKLMADTRFPFDWRAQRAALGFA